MLVRHRTIQSICHWCGSICKEGLARHIQEKCDDGLFRAACDVIRKIFGNGKVRVSKGDIKKAYVELTKRPEFKAEFITRIREQMVKTYLALCRSCRIGLVQLYWFRYNPTNTHTHSLTTPLNLPNSIYGFLKTVFCLDADISAEVKKFILKWILMTRKTAERDGLNAIGYTSQDSLSNDG
ncbi:hypothetical protein AAMO2058_001056800 [Amorphochlora amoebiformis]